MAKIKNCALPPTVTNQLLQEIELLPEPDVLAYGQEFMPGGFTKAKAIRERLAAMVRGQGPLPPALISLLNYSLPFRTTVETLSASALKELFAPLSVLLGHELLLLHLLVDDRDEVHKFAGEQLGRTFPPPTDADKEVSRNILAGFVELRFLIPGGVSLSPPGAPPAGEPDALLGIFKEALTKSEKEVARLKQSLQEEKDRAQARFKEATDKTEQERKRLTGEREQVRAKLETALKEKSAAGARCQELSAKMESAIAREVQSQTTALARKWLEAPLQIQRAAEEPVPKDLLDRAEAALARQAAQDPHTGNRVALARRCKALVEMKDRLMLAQQNALSPIAELKPAIQELGNEIDRLQKLLAGGKPASELAVRLLTVVNTSDDWDELRRYGQFMQELADFRLISSADERSCYHALHRKFSLLEERGKPKGPEVDTGWSLRDALFRNKPTLLLLDGHNILFGLPDLFAAEYENDHPGKKARQKLTGIVEKLVSPRPNIAAKICFDGPSAEVTRVRSNLEIHFSGGNGRDRADELIVSRLQFKDLQSLDQRVFVVTDDRAVRRQILQTGAKFVPNDLFAVLLADFQCLK